jgi:uncharacterized Rmd1/YagE family protein
VSGRIHRFDAVAFEENFDLRALQRQFPDERPRPRDLRFPAGAGEVFVYPFGAVVFHDVEAAQRDEQIHRLSGLVPALTTKVVRESFTAREEPDARVDLVDGTLVVDALGPGRAAVVALIVGQSAAMEYYEQLVADLFTRTARLVEPLEKRGSVPLRTAKLHRFIGEAIATRSEVITVLALLDKPDDTWDDPALDRIYDDLRAEFDLSDRFATLTQKLAGIQEALELVIDVARDRRMWLLELSIGGLIVVEVVLELLRRV